MGRPKSTEGLISGLVAALLLYENAENGVDPFDQLRKGAEILPDGKGITVLEHDLPGGLINFNIGPPETIDGLLRIPHQEKLSFRQNSLLPGTGAGLLFRQKKEDVYLQRVCILKFIHQEIAKPPLKITAHFPGIAEQITGPQQQILEIKCSGFLLGPLHCGKVATAPVDLSLIHI